MIPAALLFLALAIVVPFLNPVHTAPLPTFHTEALAFLLGGFAALSLESRRIPIPDGCAVLLAFCVYLAVQMSIVPMTTPAMQNALGIVFVAWTVAIAWTVASISAQYGRAAPILAAACAVGAFLVAVSGFVQYYDVRTVLGGFRILDWKYLDGMVGTIGQRNLFSNYVACGLAALIYLRAWRFISPLITALAGLPMIAALALSGSRSALLFVILIVLVTFGDFARVLIAGLIQETRFPKSRPVRKDRIALVGVNWSILAGVAFLAISVLAMMLGHDYTGISRFANPGGPDPRPTLISYGVRVWLEHPWFGVGLGELRNALPPEALSFDHAHNIIVQLLAETGIIGAAIVGIAFTVLGSSVRNFNVWALAVVAIQGAHSMLEFPLWNLNYLGLFGVAIGVLIAPHYTRIIK